MCVFICVSVFVYIFHINSGLPRISFYTDLSKETRLVVGIGVVRNHGYLPLTSGIPNGRTKHNIV